MISYIVSAYNRPLQLIGCLSSLISQTHKDFEIIVTDNHPEAMNRIVITDIRSYGSFDITYLRTKMETCYHSAEHAAFAAAKGEWLVFASDDSFYVPDFAQIMLDASAGFDLVYCDCVYDKRRTGKYEVMYSHPKVGHIDKTNFMVRKEWFVRADGFPEKLPPGGCSDGLLIEKLISMGARHRNVDQVLVFHS